LVDQPDVEAFVALGFTRVANQKPAPDQMIRVGLVYFDAAANQYMRWDGVKWGVTVLNTMDVPGRFSRLLARRGINGMIDGIAAASAPR
jgi:hypothetical protein